MKVNRVFKNASWIIACRLVQSVFALIINACTTRYFGPSNYGVISYAASLVAFVTPLMKLGTTDILVNEFIKNPGKEGAILGTSITMTLCSSVMCILGLLVFVSFANQGDTTTIVVVVLYSLLLVSQSLEQVQYWFHAKYLSKVVSVTSLAVYLLVTIYKIVLLVANKSIFWFAASNAIDHLLISIILIWIYTRKKGQRLCFSGEILIELWKNGRKYILPALMGLVLEQSDRIMLRFMCDEAEVGFYSAAISTAGLTSFVFAAIFTSFRPLILECKLKDQEKYNCYMNKLYGIVIYLALLQALFITVFGELVVSILYGHAYLPSTTMLRIGIWYTLFSYIGAARTVWILAEGKQQYLWIVSLSGMLLNITLNAVLIHTFGGEGAAAATLLTQIFTNVIIVYIIKPLRPNLRHVFGGLKIWNWLKTDRE